MSFASALLTLTASKGERELRMHLYIVRPNMLLVNAATHPTDNNVQHFHPGNSP